MSNRAKRAQSKVIEEKLEEMLLYYLIHSGGKEPETLAVDAKAYRGITMRWFEPRLPGVDNVVLIEECLGDQWTLRFEPFKEAITNLSPK